MTAVAIFAGFVFILSAFTSFLVILNSIVRSRIFINEALSRIKTQFEFRHEAIPPLIQLIEHFIIEEKELIESVMQNSIRSLAEIEEFELDVSESGMREVSDAESNLSRSLSRILSATDSYPELKNDPQFKKLQENLFETETRLKSALMYLNKTITDYNRLIKSFPGVLVATLMRFRDVAPFSLELPQKMYKRKDVAEYGSFSNTSSF